MIYLPHLCFFKANENFDLNPQSAASHLKNLFISSFSFWSFLSFSMEEEEDEGSSFKKAWPFKLQCLLRRDFSAKVRSQSKHLYDFSGFSNGSGDISENIKMVGMSHFSIKGRMFALKQKTKKVPMIFSGD